VVKESGTTKILNIRDENDEFNVKYKMYYSMVKDKS